MIAAILAATLTVTSTRCATVNVVVGEATDKQLLGCGDGYAENVLWSLDLADTIRDGRATRATTGSGAVVYVIDTGVEASHDEFRRDDGTSNVIAGLDPLAELSDAKPAADCVDDSPTHPCWTDVSLGTYTHGTAVASIIAGRTAGVAPGASIVSVRVMGLRDRSFGNVFVYLRAFDDIVEHAKGQPFHTAIINMSAWPPMEATDIDWPEFERKMRQMIDGVDGKRFLFVIPAGNSSGLSQCTAQNEVRYYPAARGASIDGLITAGGLDRNGAFWSGSCGGPAVDVVAPAQYILCASVTGHDHYRGLINGSDITSGTSYSAPYVAGIAARMLEADPTLSPAELEQRIKATASRTVGDVAGLIPVLREAPAPPRRRAAGR